MQWHVFGFKVIVKVSPPYMAIGHPLVGLCLLNVDEDDDEIVSRQEVNNLPLVTPALYIFPCFEQI